MLIVLFIPKQLIIDTEGKIIFLNNLNYDFPKDSASKEFGIKDKGTGNSYWEGALVLRFNALQLYVRFYETQYRMADKNRQGGNYKRMKVWA